MQIIKPVTLGCMLVLFGSLSACAPGDAGEAEQPAPAGEVEPAPAGEAEPMPDGTREAPYVGRGVIQRIGEGLLEIQHEEIPGFMSAMTMAFSIAEEAMNDSLKVGDEIIFKIALHPERGYQIFSVEAVAAE